MVHYELTNSVMEERSRTGLAVWVCRHLHKSDHRVVSQSYDDRWEVTSKDMRCSKCTRQWKDLSPLMNVIGRTLAETISPCVTELMEPEDPIYSLLRNKGTWSY